MKRDMELCRKILFAVEEQYVDTAILNLHVDGYTMEEVAYHCKILHDGGLLSYCKAQYGDDHIYAFFVGSLTWAGHEFLDKIRSDKIWNKTKEIITKKGIPMVLDVIKEVAQTVISSMVEGAIKGMK